MPAMIIILSVFMVSHVYAKTVTLEEGTLVLVKNPDLIKAADVDQGAVVNLVVAEDVIVDERAVIKKGTPVKGKVLSVSEEARMGMSGMLMIQLISTKTIDGTTISLTGKAAKGMSITEVTEGGMKAGCLMGICPFFMFLKGEAADIPANSVFKSRTDKEYKITIN